MRRLLVVSYRPLDHYGGPTARWRSFAKHLPAHGWEVDTFTPAPRLGGEEFSTGAVQQQLTRARARFMAGVGAATAPFFGLLGVRPEAFPPSMLWIPRGAAGIRRRLKRNRYDAVLATGPPFAALIAARVAGSSGAPPLALELRDLWAENPAFDRRGGLLGTLESWTIDRAALIVTCTAEARADLRARHPEAAERIEHVSNGFEPELLVLRSPHAARNGPLTILHSGTLTAGRPLQPLLRALTQEPYRSSFRLALHGYVAPPIAAEVRAARGCEVETLTPSSWTEAIQRMAAADIGLVSQARSVGDDTAVAAKVFEYLALGKPVLCLSDGGATEALLRHLGADRYCARLGDDASIEKALDNLIQDRSLPSVPESVLAPFDRSRLAGQLAALLDQLVEN